MHRERLMQDVSITWHSTNDSSSSSFSPRFSSRPSLSTRIHFREFSWEPHLHRHRCPQLQCLEPEEGAARSATPSQVNFANRHARTASRPSFSARIRFREFHGNHICIVTDVLSYSVSNLKKELLDPRLPLKFILRIVKHVLKALEYLHHICRVIHSGAVELMHQSIFNF